MVAPPAVLKTTGRAGFTLIEMSIVLVIIGLIIGGVLVGRDLISAATVRAQISQIEKYNAAVNTFRGKYGYLPGDIPDPYATQFGFNPRGAYGGTNAGQGDGNGIIEGLNSYSSVCGKCPAAGETINMWVDISKANLVDGSFNSVSFSYYPGWTYLTGSPSVKDELPTAKLGNGNFIYVWSGGITGGDGRNYFSVSAVTTLHNFGELASLEGITVAQALGIDSKIDDGLPQSGKVIAFYEDNGSFVWAGNSNAWPFSGTSPGGTAAPTAYTCFDNSSVAGATMKYSLSQSNGAGINCGLSFQFQ